jgi:hypothetical protein
MRALGSPLLADWTASVGTRASSARALRDGDEVKGGIAHPPQARDAPFRVGVR